MKQYNRSLCLFTSMCFFILGSCAQQSHLLPKASSVYVGSTPCDAYIKDQLKIPGSIVCDFIKWELSLDLEEPGMFLLKAVYGESKPNTNGFKKDIQWMVKGTYGYTQGSAVSPRNRVLHLNAPELKSTLALIELDSSILHFAQPNEQLLVGNGGWGYVLNRMK